MVARVPSLHFRFSLTNPDILRKIKNGISRKGETRRNTTTVAVASLTPGSVKFFLCLPETGGDAYDARGTDCSRDLYTVADRIHQ